VDEFTGWDRELEQQTLATMDAAALALELPVSGPDNAPIEIDPRPFMRVESQGAKGSCQGQAVTSLCEYAMAAQGSVMTQLSRDHGYYGTQKIDGLLGRDAGSTIWGGIQLAKKGICEETLWPYREVYDPRPPGGWERIETAALRFQLKSHTRTRTYDDIWSYIGLGFGGVEIGMTWNESMTPVNGVIERYRPGGRGGHAVAFLGYSRRRDSKNRPYLWLLNSYSSRWGNKGWAEVSPTAVETIMLDRYTVAIGGSDMSVPKRRTIDWLKDNPFAVSI
jgi:hypothetical protein